MATSSLPNPPTADPPTAAGPGSAQPADAGALLAETATADNALTEHTPGEYPVGGHAAASHTAGASPKLVLALASGASFLAVLDTTVVNVALPNLHTSFASASLGQLTWIITAYAVMFAALLPAAGRLADVIGRRRLFLYAVIGFTLTSLADGAAPNVDLLIAFRAVQGLMAAGMIPASLALILAYTPAAQRTAAVGTYGAISSLAAAIGPSIGGVLVDAWGWRSIFLVNVPLGIIIAARTARKLSRDAPSGRRLPDPIGTIAVAAGLGAIVVGLTQGSTWGWHSASVISPIVGGVVALAVGLAVSRSHPAPAIEWDLWRESRQFVGTNLTSLLFGSALYSYMLGSLLYLTSIWRYSELKAGLALTPGALAAAVGAVLVGRRVPLPKQWIAAVSGAVLFVVSLVGMHLWLESTPAFGEVWVPLGVVGGLGIGATLTVRSGSVAVSVPPQRFAAGTGLLMMARQMGGALGIAALAAVLTANGGLFVIHGYLNLFLYCAIGSAIAGALAVMMRPSSV
jgi:EmrB/QacA subfamily drug resistance transporter